MPGQCRIKSALLPRAHTWYYIPGIHVINSSVLHIGFILCALSSSRVFLGSRISIFCGFSDLPRVPAPLCDHALLRLRVNVRTKTTIPGTTLIGNIRTGGIKYGFLPKSGIPLSLLCQNQLVSTIMKIKTSTSQTRGTLPLANPTCSTNSLVCIVVRSCPVVYYTGIHLLDTWICDYFLLFWFSSVSQSDHRIKTYTYPVSRIRDQDGHWVHGWSWVERTI